MGLFKKKGDKAASPANSNANPYAQPPQNPYQQAKSQAYNPQGPPAGQAAPPPYSSNGRGGTPYDGDKKHPYDNGYGQQDRQQGGGYGGGGYNSNPYGGQGGYGGAGGDRYGTSQPQQGGQQGGSRYGAGGYGGMGGSDPYQSQPKKDDAGRNALFANPNMGKQLPPQQPQQGGYGAGPSRQNPYDPANPTAGDFDSTGGYTPQPYQDRELTAEEEEQQEIDNTKNEIRQIKREDVSSTRNALRAANRAEEIGRDTLARLGAQGEMIHNTEKNLDLAHNHNKIAEDKARELKTLNRSMFAVHVSNPFTSKSRREAQEQAVIDRHLEEREAREASRRAAYLSDQRMQKNFSDMDKAGQNPAQRQRNLAERAKYQFEADSEDEDMENEIDANLDALGGAAKRLNMLAQATGKELDTQNERLAIIQDKSDRVDVGLAANHARINRIK